MFMGCNTLPAFIKAWQWSTAPPRSPSPPPPEVPASVHQLICHSVRRADVTHALTCGRRSTRRSLRSGFRQRQTWWWCPGRRWSQTRHWLLWCRPACPCYLPAGPRAPRTPGHTEVHGLNSSHHLFKHKKRWSLFRASVWSWSDDCFYLRLFVISSENNIDFK